MQGGNNITEIAKIAINAFVLTNKMKILFVLFALLLSSVGLYGATTEGITSKYVSDPFVKDIQERSDSVYNVVNEAIAQQDKQSPLQYKQTCENSLSFIQNERLNTNYNYNSMSIKQKEIITKYRNFLKESGNVVIFAYRGNRVDISKMNNAKKALY